MSPDRYDVLVIGSGEAGKYLAWTLSKAGNRTAMVERRMVGGSCPNVACLPSKNIIHSAKVASLAARASEFGLDAASPATNMRGVQRRKLKMVEDLIEVHRGRYKASGVDLIMGEARFVAPKTVVVQLNDGGTRTVAGERVIVSLGTRAAIPDVPGLADVRPMTHVDALDLDRVPDHLIVVGGGYIGLELAQAVRRFGARVTVIERGSQLAGREDPDIAAALLELFRDEGIHVLLGAEITRVEGRSGEQVRVSVKADGGERLIEATDLLVAAGRTPNTQGIGVEADPRLEKLRTPILLFDAAGLGLFAVSGTEKALAYGLDPLVAAILGMLTGIGGGMLRDLLVREIPTVLHADLYAVAALAGAAVVVVGHVLRLGPQAPTMIGGAVLCFGIRLVSIRRGWSLPTAG